MEKRRHRPVRKWWSPWQLRCACGVEWWPCPDALPDDRPPPAVSLRLYDNRPGWDAPTAALPNVRETPLLTPGQAWRSRRGARW